MPKVSADFRSRITGLTRTELEKLVLKAASLNQEFYHYVLVNYIDKEYGEKDLYEASKADLEFLIKKPYRGFSDELRLANMLAACNKRINEFSKVCKDKLLEMELILYVLRIPFSLSANHFTTCFTRYNQQVYFLVKKAITNLKFKLHEDFGIQYKPTLNNYLAILHRTSNHLDYIYALPQSI